MAEGSTFKDKNTLVGDLAHNDDEHPDSKVRVTLRCSLPVRGVEKLDVHWRE